MRDVKLLSRLGVLGSLVSAEDVSRLPSLIVAGDDRLFKFPQMDFEMAIEEMASLVIAPKKVFRSMYYHVCAHLLLHSLILQTD